MSEHTKAATIPNPDDPAAVARYVGDQLFEGEGPGDTYTAPYRALWVAADEIEALRSLIRGAVEIEVLDELGWRGRGVSMSLLPGEWSGVIARALGNGREAQS